MNRFVADPDKPQGDASAFRAMLKARYATLVRHCAAMGMEMVQVDESATRMHLPCRPEFIGDPEHRLLNNGVIISLIDSTCGCAVAAHIGQARRIATLDLRVNYLRPAVFGNDLVCQASCYRMSSSVGFVRARVWQIQAEDKPVADAVATFIRSRSAHNSGLA